MDLGLNGKVAIVTGASSQIGFGKAIAFTLAKEGCNLIVSYNKNAKGAQETADQIKDLGCAVITVKLDVRNSIDVQEMVRTAITHFGKIDILVNNAGGPAGSPKPFIETTEDEWDMNIDLNLKGTLNCTKAVLAHMILSKYGKIINISSTCARIGGVNVSVYSAAKAAVITFTKGLAAEVASQGINVNCVAPGYGMTDLLCNTPQEILDNMLQAVPLKRAITPENIASAVAYLASDMSSDVIGQTLTVDGGLTMV
jgi:3-oxoacyl-[acyl-carrier protein] reductase